MTEVLKTLMELRKKWLDGRSTTHAFFEAAERDLPKIAEEMAAKDKRIAGYESFEQYVWFLLDEERVKRRGPALIVDIIRHHPAMTDRSARSAYNEPKQNGEAK